LTTWLHQLFSVKFPCLFIAPKHKSNSKKSNKLHKNEGFSFFSVDFHLVFCNVKKNDFGRNLFQAIGVTFICLNCSWFCLWFVVSLLNVYVAICTHFSLLISLALIGNA